MRLSPFWKVFDMIFARYFVLAVCLSIAPTPIALGKDIEQLDVTVLVSRLITTVIRPGFADLEQSADTMSVRLESYCEVPTPAAHSSVREAFDRLVVSWGRVEFVRLGPLGGENRLERMLFWPDRRGRGLKQVRDIIRLAEKTALDPALLSQKSVAVQGLLALEYTLFSERAEDELSSPDSYRCAYASAISDAIVMLTAEINSLWQLEGKGSISDIWLNASPANRLFRDETEQFSAVVGIIEDGLEIISHQRLKPILRDRMESARPKSALFWRSENTIPSLQANLEGFEAILGSAGFEQTVEGDDRRTISSLNFELANARRAISDLELSPLVIVADKETYDRLNYVDLVVGSMLTITRDMIKPIFGLSSGFSSLDGD